MNENKRIRSKYVKKERTRLNELYRVAFRNDPRIKEHEEAEEKEKLQKKQDKYDRKQKAKGDELKMKNDQKSKIEETKRLEEEAKDNKRNKVLIQKKLRYVLKIVTNSIEKQWSKHSNL
jgi:DnaJ family protein C protein 2